MGKLVLHLNMDEIEFLYRAITAYRNDIVAEELDILNNVKRLDNVEKDFYLDEDDECNSFLEILLEYIDNPYS